MGRSNEDGDIVKPGLTISPTTPVREFTKRTRRGEIVTVKEHVRGKDDTWLKASPLRRIVNLLAAFRQDVSKEIPNGEVTYEMFDAWWEVVEERDWHDLAAAADWLTEFAQPLRYKLRYRHSRSGKPPMVRILEEVAAKRLPLSEPSSAFLRYHLMRPEVYERFKQLAEEKLQSGHSRYSATGLLAELRAAGLQHSAVRFSPEYARKLILEDARFADFFVLGTSRKGQKAKRDPSTEEDSPE